MKRYRILSNTNHQFRVQKRFSLGALRFWTYEKYYEVNDTYPKVIAHPVEFSTETEAEAFIRQQVAEKNQNKKWRVVKSFTDSNLNPEAKN